MWEAGGSGSENGFFVSAKKWRKNWHLRKNKKKRKKGKKEKEMQICQI